MAKETSSPMLNKVYCFTTSYNRPYHLYNTINNILNQSYKDIYYYININIDNESEEILFNNLVEDLLDDRLHLLYSYNEKQYINYIKALNLCDNDDDAIYIKIDDDDIYHKQYIEFIVNSFNNSNTDILSSNIYRTINNNQIINKKMTSIGYWSGDDHHIKFGFPTTYAFNNKAKQIIHNISHKDYAIIHPFEDAVWRTFWRKAGLKSTVMDNTHFTYHIHNKNVSSSHLLNNSEAVIVNQSYIENDYCLVALFQHKSWESYIFLNKRNNRCYHINHDDHGTFQIIHDTISIFWEDYDKRETFTKHRNGNLVYRQND